MAPWDQGTATHQPPGPTVLTAELCRPSRHRLGDVPEPVEPGPPDRDRRELAGLRQGAFAHQNLAPGGDGAEARSDVDGAAVPVAVVPDRGSAVHPNPNGRQRGVAVDMCDKPQGKANRAGRVLAADHRCVSHRLYDLRAVMRRDVPNAKLK